MACTRTAMSRPLPYEPVKVRYLLDQLLPPNVTTFFHSRLFAVDMEGERIARVHLAGVEGPFSLRRARYVDATGNASLAGLCATPLRRGENSTVQAASSMFRVIGADVDPRDVRTEIRLAIEKHNASGQAEAFKRSAVAVYVHPDQRLLHFNATRVYFESTADDALAAALDMSRVKTEARKGSLPAGRAAGSGRWTASPISRSSTWGRRWACGLAQHRQ